MGSASAHLGLGHPGRPLYDNQLGHRLPTGGPPATGQLSMPWPSACSCSVRSRCWPGGRPSIAAHHRAALAEVALASLTTIALVAAVEGGPGPALAHHFSG